MTTQTPPGYGTPPPPPGWTPPPPPPAPRKKRHRLLYSLLAGIGVIVVIIVASVAAGGSGGTSSTTSNAPAASAAPATSAAPSAGTTARTAGIGTPVRDGKFEFTVTAVTYAHKVGDQFLGKTAQGRYALLHVTVKNIGTEAQTLSDSSQHVYDASGRKYSADTEADLYTNSNSTSVFLNDINPGNTVSGVIAFDMPRGTTPVHAVLHDSPFSGGVTVSLR
jgi:Domain of unknown function (DUF4352)